MTSSARRSDRVRVRALRSVRDLREAVDLQIEVWGMDPRDTMPWSQMLLSGRHGGIVLGAFDGACLVGFLYAFVGRDDATGEAFMYSKMLGVRATHRGLGIGRTLKRLQRRAAIRMGYRRVQWTFDPLERASAVLNVGYLGVVARRYVESFYGAGGIGRLHTGLATDRLVAEWYVGDAAVAARQRRRRLPTAPATSRVLVDVHPRTGRPVTGERARVRAGMPGLVAIPADVQRLKREAPRIARAWQRAYRQILGPALAAGAEVVDVARRPDGGESYVLVHPRTTRKRGARAR